MSDGKITELTGCADRAAAAGYSQSGEVPDALAGYLLPAPPGSA
jgi:hypothetical protein